MTRQCLRQQRRGGVVIPEAAVAPFFMAIPAAVVERQLHLQCAALQVEAYGLAVLLFKQPLEAGHLVAPVALRHVRDGVSAKGRSEAFILKAISFLLPGRASTSTAPPFVESKLYTSRQTSSTQSASFQTLFGTLPRPMAMICSKLREVEVVHRADQVFERFHRAVKCRGFTCEDRS